MTLYNYGAVKVGDKFRTLTLKQKGGKKVSDWLMHCESCDSETWIKRNDVVRGKWAACGSCGPRRPVQKKQKSDNILHHFKIPGFKKVEKRAVGDFGVWWVFRKIEEVRREKV